MFYRQPTSGVGGARDGHRRVNIRLRRRGALPYTPANASERISRLGSRISVTSTPTAAMPAVAAASPVGSAR